MSDLCQCTDPDRPLFTWRGDPEWWSCSYCDERVRPKEDAASDSGGKPDAARGTLPEDRADA